MKNKFKVGQWVMLPFHEEAYKITKLYQDENLNEVVDLDDGDNYRIIGKSIDKILEIPKRNKGK